MATHKKPVTDLPKVDRRGSTILVPIGIRAVFAVLAVLMLMRNSWDGTPPPPLGETAAKIQRPN
jgi:hypothetical protein